MKEKLLAQKIRRMIQKDVNNFFKVKLNSFNGDIEKLLTDSEVINEVDQYLQEQEEKAIKKIKEQLGINFHDLDFNTKRAIIRKVEEKIFQL